MMLRLQFNLVCLFLLTLTFPFVSNSADTNEPNDEKPNVVFIISDDQAWNDYSFLDHPHIKTPALDKLAKQSFTFTRGYVPIALCRPSLATIITGLYPHQHLISGNDPAIPKGIKYGSPPYQKLRKDLIGNFAKTTTLAEILSKAGYVSHQSGKWWEGDPTEHGFTEGMTHGDPKRGGRHGDEGLKVGRKGLQPVFDFVDKAIKDEKPFFLWYAPFLPHTPHNPPAELLNKYKQEGRPIQLAKYYAMCEWFDQTCGDLLGFLDDKKVSENTLVVYVTDNGWIQRTPKTKVSNGWRPQFAPRSKQSPNEGGVRTPIMIRWPSRIKPVYDETTLVSSIDIVPTVLSACGLPIPKNLLGENLMDHCSSKERLSRTAIFGESYAHDIADINEPSQSLTYRWVIDGDWKLITKESGKIGRYPFLYKDIPTTQLYNLKEDPHEKKNLAKDQDERVQKLLAKLNQHLSPSK